MLKAEALSYRYDNSVNNIFEGLSFDFHKRNLIHIKGLNGTGKSTLFYCLCGFSGHYLNGEMNGRILFNDQELDSIEIKDKIQSINLLFQNPSLQMCFSRIYEDVFYLLRQCNRMDDAKMQEFMEYLDLFRIKIDRNATKDELSWGQKKLICLISILLSNPQVYLLDEPFSGISDGDREVIRGILYQKRMENRLILVSDHSGFEMDYNHELNMGEYAVFR